MPNSSLSVAEQQLLERLNRLIHSKQSNTGLRRILSYVAAIVASGEGKIIEKDLKLHFQNMDNFFSDIREELILNEENDQLLEILPFSALINRPPSRAQ
jgi:hypothetical protein